MRGALLIALLVLPACREDVVELPEPVPMTAEALSHFCQMAVSNHPGPKGQIHLKGFPDPLFFAQVRDLIAYLKSPEREAEIAAVYVSDMGSTPSWHRPEMAAWINADNAHFVIDANVAGGMGAPEIVPFAVADDAGQFSAKYGGRIVVLEDIPDDAALGPVDLDNELEEPA